MDQNPYSVGTNLNAEASEIRGPKFGKMVRRMQILWTVFVTGIPSCFCVVLIYTKGNVFDSSVPKSEALVAAGFGFSAILISFFYRWFKAGLAIRRTKADSVSEVVGLRKIEQICDWYRLLLMLDLMSLGGTAMANLTFVMNRNTGLNFGVAAMLTCLMLTRFPARSRISSLVQNKLAISGMSYDPNQTAS